MLNLHKAHQFLVKTFTTSTFSTQKSHLDWRTQAKQAQLLSQITTILLQTHTKHWPSLFKTLKLSSTKQLNPSFFHQVFHRIQSQPQISLNFYNWATKNLDFEPDLKAQCKLVQILIGSGLSRPAKPIVDTLIQAHPPSHIVFSLTQSCKGTNFDDVSRMLSSVLEGYCKKSMYLQALEVYVTAKNCQFLVSVYSCNALLSVLLDKNEIQLAWCLYSSMKRNGVVENQFTLSLIARFLCKDGKSERIVRFLDVGIYSPVIYNLLIEYYSKKGDFQAAFGYLDEMSSKKFDPTFSTYSSILDGACERHDIKVVEKVMACMSANKLMPGNVSSDYDSVIQKLSDLGETYAAELFYKKACEEKVVIRDASYGCMLRALSKDGRGKDAIGVYRIISTKGLVVNASCYNEFLHFLCKESPSEEVSGSLKDVIRRGFQPPAAEISQYINSLCVKRKWKQALELLLTVLEKGFLPDPSCCCSLVKHYCSIRRIDLAIELHNKMEKVGGTFDITTYNLFLNGLFRVGRVEEAVRVHDYARRHDLLSSEIFSTMILGLCHEKKLREAMKLHDEMLKLGLKPGEKTYKRVISGFS